MKYVVLGAAGQLGRDLVPRLPGEVIPLTRAEADLTHPTEIRQLLENLRPDVVINCAAYNFVDRAESEPEQAFAVNAESAREVAKVCADLDCLMVQLSTDYVFGLDEEQQPRAEPAPPGPVSVYGLSKLTGEYWVRMTCRRHLIIRTCGLYGVWGSGGKGGNFIETMLRLAREGKPLRVVDDQICTPSYTVDIAEAIVPLVATERYGVHHLTNAGSCSWHELAGAAFEMAGVEADLTPILSAEYGAPARRPAYSVLSMEKYQSLGLAPPRHWREALAAYLDERQQRGQDQ